MVSTKGKIVSKYCNIWKTPGRGYFNPSPPLPLYRDHGGGMNLRARPRVKLNFTLILYLFIFESFKMLIFLGIITNKLQY